MVLQCYLGQGTVSSPVRPLLLISCTLGHLYAVCSFTTYVTSRYLSSLFIVPSLLVQLPIALYQAFEIAKM